MYYLPFVLALLLLFFPKVSKKSKIVIISIPVILIIIFRFGIGADYFNYEQLYISLRVDSFEEFIKDQERIEVGYRLLEYIFRNLNTSYTVFSSVLGISIYSIIVTWIYRNSNNFVLSFLLFYSMFFLVWVLSAYRQGIVIGILLFVFFDKKINLSWQTKVIVVAVLSQVHLSALIMLIFVFHDAVKWNRKRLVLLFGISIAFSLIPISQVVNQFSFISPSIRGYFTDSSFVSFSNIIRLLIFSFLIYFYNRFNEGTYERKIMNYILNGLSLYFLLRFTGIGAARFSIYTFFLLPLVLTFIHETFRDNNSYYKMGIGLLILFSSLFFYKETQSVIYQSDYIIDGRYLTFESIFDKDYSKFEQKNALIVSDTFACRIDKNLYLTSVRREEVSYKEGDQLLAVRDPDTNLFGVINQDGDWILLPTYRDSITLQGNIAMINSWGNVANIKTLIDLSGRNRTEAEMWKEVEKTVVDRLYFDASREVRTEPNYNQLPQSVRNLLPREGLVTNISKMDLNNPISFTVYKMSIYGRYYFAYVNPDGTLLHEHLSITNSKADMQGFILINRDCSTYYTNSVGAIVWMMP